MHNEERRADKKSGNNSRRLPTRLGRLLHKDIQPRTTEVLQVPKVRPSPCQLYSSQQMWSKCKPTRDRRPCHDPEGGTEDMDNEAQALSGDQPSFPQKTSTHSHFHLGEEENRPAGRYRNSSTTTSERVPRLGTSNIPTKVRQPSQTTHSSTTRHDTPSHSTAPKKTRHHHNLQERPERHVSDIRHGHHHHDRQAGATRKTGGDGRPSSKQVGNTNTSTDSATNLSQPHENNTNHNQQESNTSKRSDRGREDGTRPHREEGSVQILQWNINGVRGKHHLLMADAKDNKRDVILFQETKLPENITIKFNGYTAYHSHSLGQSQGCSILVRTYIPNKRIENPINCGEGVETLGVTQNLNNEEITVYNTYNSPNNPELDVSELLALCTTTPTIIGDLNAHHTAIGSRRKNRRGYHLAAVMNSVPEAILMNAGEPAHTDGGASCTSHGYHVTCTVDLPGAFTDI
ncbi:hypothetical protein E2C01_057409 [Portunus trituberculatus]|uniref:Endonuclease/exonuclease/phosphatase domain-containing protein n=1 Tax=Portunus trituberculatus TaxID=210409 RepID=A0A5B7GWQ2_PORTR|nr:hypothetical protein [Portunus trituberculatus]